MAQNAYRYSRQAAAVAQPSRQQKPSKKVRTKVHYGPAVWTKKERALVILMASVVFVVMILTILTSIQMQKVEARNQAVLDRTTKVKEQNDSLRGDIQNKTNRDNLEKVAQDAHMQQSVENVRNVNR
ncbi:cell division protein FtsL [Leuconostocaceae bacterium ESL0958]|nr:cell division protein FtsL [Leuconostocaceae bacterium ESL0958]